MSLDVPINDCWIFIEFITISYEKGKKKQKLTFSVNENGIGVVFVVKDLDTTLDAGDLI